MRIYVTGCSMTYGAEIAGEEPMTRLSPSQNEFRLQHCWGGVLAAQLGRSFLNSGHGGSCNERILRSLVQDVERHALGTNDLVIIGWTEMERTEYVFEGEWYQQTVNYRPKFYREKRYIDDYARLMLNTPERTWERFLTLVMLAQQLLRSRHIPYLMFNALPPLNTDDYPTVPASLNYLKQGIDTSLWATPMEVHYQCMFCRVMHLPLGPEKHPLKEGHALWANILHDHVTRAYPGMVSTTSQPPRP